MSDTERDAADLEALLDYLKRSRGFDFTGYKRASLARRISKRMQATSAANYRDYLDYLEVHPEEFAALFNTILINVTSFFRDESAWDALRSSALPEMLARKGPTAPIRVWSAGCATGEEAYTLAMIFSELLGADAFHERVKIYATDADEEALAKARGATYTEANVENVAPPLLAKYFEEDHGSYSFAKDIRRQVIFGRHDIIQDAPISRVDLLVCRNVLMYFNAETQAHILARFHFALSENGLLFLGRAETLLSHQSTFAPIDLKRRISVKIPRTNLSLRDRLMLVAQNDNGEEAGAVGQQIRLREMALEASPTALIIIDTQGAMVLANDRARQTFALQASDLGRPLQDLKLSYRPVELRSLIDQIYLEKQPLLVRDVEARGIHGDVRWYDLQLTPLLDAAGAVVGASAAYIDCTVSKRLQSELEHTSMELEAAYEELQSTNEELETTNEELQSTVEELETTNEELQSTNEELETMNEELQSTNEELTTINDEVRIRSDELNTVNVFLASVLGSLRGGVVVVDPQLDVLVWNERATDLWGLHGPEAIGKSFYGLDIGLPVDELKGAIRACLRREEASVEVTVDATNRRGRSILCRVTCTPLLDDRNQVLGVILVMDEVAAGVQKTAVLSESN